MSADPLTGENSGSLQSSKAKSRNTPDSDNAVETKTTRSFKGLRSSKQQKKGGTEDDESLQRKLFKTIDESNLDKVLHNEL